MLDDLPGLTLEESSAPLLSEKASILIIFLCPVKNIMNTYVLLKGLNKLN